MEQEKNKRLKDIYIERHRVRKTERTDLNLSKGKRSSYIESNKH